MTHRIVVVQNGARVGDREIVDPWELRAVEEIWWWLGYGLAERIGTVRGKFEVLLVRAGRVVARDTLTWTGPRPLS